MSDDLIKLYSDRILALAASIPLTGPLPDADGCGKVRSPLCGSTVEVCVNLDGQVVTAFSQNVKACALGQAAASVVGAAVIGQSRATIQRGRDELNAMLTQSAPPPGPPWDGLGVLKPAEAFKNRHPSILLAFDATLAAIEDAMC